MNRWITLAALILAAPVAAQTTNDDTSATENWWDKVGADFFSDATMEMPRPEYEIRAQWTGLSADDQAAVRARCAAARGQSDGTAPSLQEADENNAPDTTEADRAAAPRPAGEAAGAASQAAQADLTTTTGAVEGRERQVASPDGQPAPYTGLAGGFQEGTPRMVRICDLIAEL
jgi:hypothetical protein